MVLTAKSCCGFNGVSDDSDLNSSRKKCILLASQLAVSQLMFYFLDAGTQNSLFDNCPLHYHRVLFFNNWRNDFASAWCVTWNCVEISMAHVHTEMWMQKCFNVVEFSYSKCVFIFSSFTIRIPSHLQWGGQRSKSTASRHQTDCKCSPDPELMMCNEDGEVKEHESNGESFSSSFRLWITLTSNNFQPLTLHNVRLLRLSLTDISQIASCTFKDDSLWAQEGVESSRASKEHLFPQGHLIF